jgi:protein-S-isoprenylcysteine O-methyltransferase Ste14
MTSVFTRITCVAWFAFLLAWLSGYFQQKRTERVPLPATQIATTGAVREGHERVQSGPYCFVRHPIYTGLLFAMLGTAVTIGTAASYIAVLLVLFLVRIRRL